MTLSCQSWPALCGEARLGEFAPKAEVQTSVKGFAALAAFPSAGFVGLQLRTQGISNLVQALGKVRHSGTRKTLC